MMDEKSLFRCLFFLLVTIKTTEDINPQLDSDVLLETNHEHDHKENVLYPNAMTFIEVLEKSLSDTETITGSKIIYDKIENLTFKTWYCNKKQVNSYIQRRRELKNLRITILACFTISLLNIKCYQVKDDIESKLTLIALQWYVLKCQILTELLVLIEQEFEDNKNILHHTIGIFLDIGELLYKWIS